VDVDDAPGMLADIGIVGDKDDGDASLLAVRHPA